MLGNDSVSKLIQPVEKIRPFGRLKDKKRLRKESIKGRREQWSTRTQDQSGVIREKDGGGEPQFTLNAKRKINAKMAKRDSVGAGANYDTHAQLGPGGRRRGSEST